jgi:hypothetical protein
MADWLILLLVVPAIIVPVVMLVGFAGCQYVFPVDPYRPGEDVDTTGSSEYGDPFIDSADGKSFNIITLTWHWGGFADHFQFERTNPDNSTTPFPAPASPFDDTLDLDPGKKYTYTVRAVDSNGDAISAWSAPVTGTTLFEEAYAQTLVNDEDNWEGWTLVQRIEAGQLSSGGSQVRLTLRASSASEASIDRIYISQPAADPTPSNPTPDKWDSNATTMKAVYDPPNPTPYVIAKGTSWTPDAIDYNVDPGQPLLIAVDFSAPPAASGIMYMELPVPDTSAQGYSYDYNNLGVPEAGLTDGNRSLDYGYETPNRYYLIEKIEVGG